MLSAEGEVTIGSLFGNEGDRPMVGVMVERA